jgi:hypothetical protein
MVEDRSRRTKQERHRQSIARMRAEPRVRVETEIGIEMRAKVRT